MKRCLTRARSFAGTVLLAAAGIALPAASSASALDGPLSLVILRENAPGGYQDFTRRLEETGGHAAITVPPRTLWVYADPAILDSGELRLWIAEAHRDAVDPASFSDADPEVVRMARVWNRFLEMEAAESLAAPVHTHEHVAPDAGPIPVTLSPAPAIARDAYDHIPYGAEYYDTSSYLAGSVAVGVWLLEAAGSTYDWSTDEEVETLAGVMAGFDRWVVEHGGTLAFLSFVADIHTGVPVSGVPIENPQGWDSIWIGEVLTNEGWAGGNAFEQCFAYNNSIRNLFETNWTYSLFIVDSDPAVNQGLFSGGGYAWAYYGGPFIWMSRYSTWAYNAANYFEAVPMHEMGHIFFATDEYDGVQQSQGYLNYPDNPNINVVCLLNQNVEDRICAFTKRQLGWRDSDGNDVMEPLDIAPDAVLDEYLPDPTENPTPTWTGSANVNTVPNVNPADPYFPRHDITVATIEAVECRVDGGVWMPATALDGAFDAYVEAFDWTAPSLAPGVHLVEAKARTSVGIETTVFGSDTIEILPSVGVGDVASASTSFSLRAARPNPARGETRLSFSLPRESWMRLGVYSVDGTRIRTLVEGIRPAGAGGATWDGLDDRGQRVPAGVYLYRLESAGETRTRKMTLLR